MHSRLGHLNALRVVFSFLFILILFPVRANSEDWSPLVNRLAADGFEESAIRALFQRSEVEFDPLVMKHKIESLIRIKYYRAPPSGSGKSKAARIYKGFERPEIIDGAFAFMQDNSKLLEDAQTRYGVPKEIIVSILLVETRLGEYTGNRNAFNSLASMALCIDFEKIRPAISPELLTEKTEGFAAAKCQSKAQWAYVELKALIRYALDGGIDLMSVPGSIYGAIGICQFMPSQVSRHGVDADGDGKIDLFARADAFHSVANYLKNHGWKANMSRKQQVKAIYAYNHSSVYANTVLTVAQGLNKRQVAQRRQQNGGV